MLQPTPAEPPIEPQADAAPAQPTLAQGRQVTLDETWRAGRKLSEARRQLGLGIDEVAERIRIRREFLEALEEMNPKLLPGKAYTLAFLRSYARELGLQPEEIVKQFQSEVALTREEAQKQIRNPASRPHPERPWMAAAALVVLAAGFVGWRALNQQDQSGQAADAGSAATAPAIPAAANAEDGEQRVVEIRALSEAWLETRGPDGTVFLSRTLQPGDVYRPDPSPGWTLHARDGGAFELYVNGQSAGLLGAAGMPVLGRQIDEVQPLAQANVSQPRS